MKDTPLYQFLGKDESFRSSNPDQIHSLYFPLANQRGVLSAITPQLHGDIKLDQHSFLTVPVSIEDLHLSQTARGFWFSVKKGSKKVHWALNGNSSWQRANGTKEDEVQLEAGLLWHQVKRTNKKLGLEATVLNFVPADDSAFEVMMVDIKNTGKSSVEIQATSAIPLYARSADNLRDHRHVTSLLHRIQQESFGMRVTPTMSFNEEGHQINRRSYYVLGVNDKGQGPEAFYPTLDSFVGESGTLAHPDALIHGRPAKKEISESDQGKEALGGLQFPSVKLPAGGKTTFILFLGFDDDQSDLDAIVKEKGKRKVVQSLLKENQNYWKERNNLITFETGNADFNRWTRWVNAQPMFRKIFGCSFLPDFDYGRGGRGWRDLWQDCLALLLQNPEEVRPLLLNNFNGVRFDGSNATIIGGTKGGVPQFLADRNRITRTWMDHGVWPFMTTELYIHQTGDWKILLDKRPYFRDAQLRRGRKLDTEWLKNEASGSDQDLLNQKGDPVQGTILEHILVQHLVQFFNVGEHGMIRLEDADWNDGLDMGRDRGESVAFTSMYAGNFTAIADLLELVQQREGWTEVTLAAELTLLLDRVGSRIDYDSIPSKQARLVEFYEALENGLSGDQASVPLSSLIHDLRSKAAWFKKEINDKEWLDVDGYNWFNGYYDNKAERVEGKKNDRVQMTLTGQVYPIMSGVAEPDRIQNVITAVNEYLWDHELGGLRLNSNFGQIQPNLGRAFSFAYGEKENGAIFSHMVVMYANALYRRGFVEEGFRSLQSLFTLAKNSKRSRIFPGLPEYFNNEGRGRYHYLTGSASWYVFTLLTEVFGVRGYGGDLKLAPKLVTQQFSKKKEARVSFSFAGRRINVVYQNPKMVSYEQMKIQQVSCDGTDIPFSRLSDKEILIQRELLRQRETWDLMVTL